MVGAVWIQSQVPVVIQALIILPRCQTRAGNHVSVSEVKVKTTDKNRTCFAWGDFSNQVDHKAELHTSHILYPWHNLIYLQIQTKTVNILDSSS